MGLMNFSQDWTVIRALNPYYAIQLLFSADNKLGLFILGNIFLATTGAEALYSDLGHVGKTKYSSELALRQNLFGYQLFWAGCVVVECLSKP